MRQEIDAIDYAGNYDEPEEGAAKTLEDITNDYCMDCSDGNDDTCESCHVRKIMDRYFSKLCVVGRR